MASQYLYESSETQAIGRARRYGQQKVVHIYRFFSLKTIDVDILEHRTHKKLVKNNGQFELADSSSSSTAVAAPDGPVDEWGGGSLKVHGLSDSDRN